MKTKLVCRKIISPCVNFHYNLTMWSKTFAGGGKKEKEPGVVDLENLHAFCVEIKLRCTFAMRYA